MVRKDTTEKVPADSGVFPFRERKRKVDGTVHDYKLRLIHRDGRVAIARFEMPDGGGPPRLPVAVPPGSVSYGYFWSRRPYIMYRMFGPGGVLLCHRFDAVTDLRIDADGIDYRDLELDWVVLPDGTIIEEDRDEFEEVVAAGKVCARDIERANEAALQVWSRYRHIIDEAEELERRWVRGER